MDLSKSNPCSWTPSNLAENLIEKFTGSEGLGDMAGLFSAVGTLDVWGAIDQSLDLAENLIAGAEKFLNGFSAAAKDGWSEFSNPGQVKAPNSKDAGNVGWGETGGVKSPEDIGNFGDLPPLGAGGAKGGVNVGGNVEEAAQNNEDFSFLNDPNMSLEDKIFALLMKLQKRSEDRIGGEMNKIKGKEGQGGKVEQSDMQELNRATNELQMLNTLATNMMKLFKDMKDAVTQNIGR